MFIFFDYLIRLPLYVVWLVGLGLALAHRRRHPRTSAFATIAFVCLFAATLFIPPRGFWGAPWGPGSRWTGGQMSWLVVAGGLLYALLNTIAWVLILVAIYGGRKPAVGSPAQGR